MSVEISERGKRVTFVKDGDSRILRQEWVPSGFICSHNRRLLWIRQSPRRMGGRRVCRKTPLSDWLFSLFHFGCCGVLFRNLPLRQGTQGKLPKRVSSINIKKEETNEANFSYLTFPLIRHSVLINYLEVGRVWCGVYIQLSKTISTKFCWFFFKKGMYGMFVRAATQHRQGVVRWVHWGRVNLQKV